VAKLGSHDAPNGWDGPVAIRMPGEGPAWENDAKTLAALIAFCAPINKGTLKKDLSLRRGKYKRIPKPGKGFEMTFYNAYASIQDEGGHVPARFPQGYLQTTPDDQGVEGHRAGKALRFRAGGTGEYVFAKRAGPFDVPATHFVQRGFDRWIGSRGHAGQGIHLEWVPPYGASEGARGYG
jgi:hypothetical protein